MSCFQVWIGFLLALSLLNSCALVYSYPTPNSPSHPPHPGAFYFFSPPPPSPTHYPKTPRPVGLGPPPPRFRVL
ncbi:hypothetical protein AAZV13_04G032100 [Glycine max]